MAAKHSVQFFGSRRAKLSRLLSVLVWAAIAFALTLVNVPSPGNVIVGSLIVGAIGVACWRAVGLRLDVGTDGVVVRNFYWTHTFDWGEVNEIGNGFKWGVLHTHPGVEFTTGTGFRPVVAEATAYLTPKQRRALATILARAAASNGVACKLAVDHLDEHPSSRRIGGSGLTLGR